MATLAERQVAHVWRRLGMGPIPAELTAGATIGPQVVIADLLNRPLTTPAQWGFTSATDWTAEQVWLGQLLRNMQIGNPAQERLSWVFRNLVVVGIADFTYVKDVRDHIYRLRQDPFASYKQLLTDITIMPGMMTYLTGCKNSKQHPNQNYARELCELFTLGRVDEVTGQANYAEFDVQEIARALTGYVYDWNTGLIKWSAASYDSGPKTIFGVPRGNIGVPGVLDAIASHPSFATHVPARLYRELVGLDPTASTLQSLGSLWGTTGDVRAVVTAICNLPEFLSAEAIGARVKTPIELLVASGRVLNLDLSKSDFGWQLRDLLGMHPMLPPNVGGWPAGTRWLNAGGLMSWNGIVQSLCSSARANAGVAGSPVTALFATPKANVPDEAARLTCITDLTPSTRAAIASYVSAASWTLDRAAGALGLCLVSPEFATN
jgi:uncharacterized protein (DUF1800 family)